MGLYKHIVNIVNPSMGFIGIISKNCPLPQFDLQARFFVRHLLGEFNLPSRREMEEELESQVEDHLAANKPLRHFHCIHDVQWKYCRELSQMAKFPVFPDASQAMFDEVFDRRFNFLMGYKKETYAFVKD